VAVVQGAHCHLPYPKSMLPVSFLVLSLSKIRYNTYLPSFSFYISLESRLVWIWYLMFLGMEASSDICSSQAGIRISVYGQRQRSVVKVFCKEPILQRCTPTRTGARPRCVSGFLFLGHLRPEPRFLRHHMASTYARYLPTSS